MPRPRRKGSPRKRDYAAEHAARQKRARAKGHSSYYAQRVSGVPKGRRAAARGHRSRADFLSSLGPGDQVILADPISTIELYTDKKGVERFLLVRKLVIYAISGREARFTLRRLSRAEMRATIREEERRGVSFSPAPSRDQRRLAPSESDE